MCVWCVCSCPNDCNGDTRVCVSGVFPVVLMLVMRVPVSVYLMYLQLS